MPMTTELQSCEAEPVAGEQLAEELAACLARFLDASADERTMKRAREALALWHRLDFSAAEDAGQDVVGEKRDWLGRLG